MPKQIWQLEQEGLIPEDSHLLGYRIIGQTNLVDEGGEYEIEGCFLSPTGNIEVVTLASGFYDIASAFAYITDIVRQVENDGRVFL